MSSQWQSKWTRGIVIASAGMLSLLLGGCLPRSNAPEPFLYDLGALPVALHSGAAMSAENMVGLPEIRARGAIDSTDIVFRYSNVQTHEPKKYAQSRWVQRPAEMLRIRAQQYLGAEHAVVLSAEMVNRAPWVLMLSLEDFSQHFSSEQTSVGVVQLRATLVNNGKVMEQKLFRVELPAASPDASGAVKALADATDEVLKQAVAWVDAWLPH